jgi:hypothetical protein
MPWYAIRSVYEHGRDEDGTAVFCERVLIFRAPKFDDACALAERESARYLELNPEFTRIGEFTGFAIRARDLPSEGAEVWCMLYRDTLSGSDFYAQRYKQLELPLVDNEG